MIAGLRRLRVSYVQRQRQSAGIKPNPRGCIRGTRAFNEWDRDERLNLRVHSADNSLLPRSMAPEPEQPMPPSRELRIPICRNPRRFWVSFLLEIHQTY